MKAHCSKYLCGTSNIVDLENDSVATKVLLLTITFAVNLNSFLKFTFINTSDALYGNGQTKVAC